MKTTEPHQMNTALTPYGLHTGRMTVKNNAAHNGSWYNKKGEKIGWGDLDYSDLYGLTRKLKEDEAFIVLSEHDSYWPFVSFPSKSHLVVNVDPKERSPGLEFVAERARHLVYNGEIFTRTHLVNTDGSTRYETRYGVNVVLLDQEEMKKKVLGL